MSDSTRRIDSSALFTGLLLVGVGVLFLLDRFHFAHFGDLMRTWWPMVIVLVGVSRLLHRRSVWSGLWLIAIGTWLQLVRLHLFEMTFRNSWPLLLIIIGAGIALKAVFDVSAEERHEL